VHQRTSCMHGRYGLLQHKVDKNRPSLPLEIELSARRHVGAKESARDQGKISPAKEIVVYLCVQLTYTLLMRNLSLLGDKIDILRVHSGIV
jgi:hypothetical protein